MTVANTQSPADRALERYVALVGSKAIFRQGDPTLTESDTRAKLIDPMFKTVLGWNEAEIRREEPVKKGYVDYVFGSKLAGIRYRFMNSRSLRSWDRAASTDLIFLTSSISSNNLML